MHVYLCLCFFAIIQEKISSLMVFIPFQSTAPLPFRVFIAVGKYQICTIQTFAACFALLCLQTHQRPHSHLQFLRLGSASCCCTVVTANVFYLSLYAPICTQQFLCQCFCLHRFPKYQVNHQCPHPSAE